MSFIFTRYC